MRQHVLRNYNVIHEHDVSWSQSSPVSWLSLVELSIGAARGNFNHSAFLCNVCA